MNFLQHAKYVLPLTIGKGIVVRFIFFLTFILLLFHSPSFAQKTEPAKDSLKSQLQKKDTLPENKKPAAADTSQVKTDSTKNTPKSDIESTIQYSAEDSIVSELQKKIVRLYGNAKVVYGQITLDAEEIVIDYETSTITANGKRDSTGQLVGFPIFKDGEHEYETKGMVYNFKNKKAKITEVVTKEGEGFMHGETVYKNDKNELFTRGNGYTTCDLADPHYRIISGKAKAIPGDKVVSGPFYMEFNHVPTPLAFIFGIFPSQRKSSSGIIVPAYGEEQTRGFFLRNGGYYFDINDYFKLSVTGDIYTKGSSGLYVRSTYISRYKYNGSFAFTFNNNNYSTNLEKPDKRKDFSLTWSHSPKSKGNSRFAASVNMASSTNNANNYLGIGQPNTASIINSNAQQKASSNVSYSLAFPGTPFALATNFRINQDFKTRRVDLSLPDISFNVNNLYPFKKSNTMILQNFQIKYTMAAVNQINNDLGNIATNPDGTKRDSIGAFNFQNLPTYLQNANKGFRHSIPVSTSFKVLKYATLTGSVNFTEYWYFDKLVWGTSNASDVSLGTQAVKIDTIHQFNRESFYNFSMGLTTRIYGIRFARKKTSTIRAIRHVMSPSIGFSYAPDFSDPKYGYYQRVGVTDASGKPTTVLKSIHEGFIYGFAPAGRNQSMSFGLGNTVEMKVRKPKDTVDRKISIFNNLSLGSSYNFLADSFKLAPISISANSNVLDNKININLSGTLDPYQYWTVKTGPFDENNLQKSVIVRKDQYAWNAGGLGKITQASLAFGTNLSPKGKKKDAEMREKIGKSNASQADKDYLLKNPNSYVDFSIPWNLRLSYNISYSSGLSTTPSLHPSPIVNITQAAQFSGDFSLSEKWKITFSSSYDFVQHQIGQTSFSLNRDLHCWQMSLQWVPFGKFQSYAFNIGIKSSLLKDLKLNRTRSFIDSQGQGAY